MAITISTGPFPDNCKEATVLDVLSFIDDVPVQHDSHIKRAFQLLQAWDFDLHVHFGDGPIPHDAYNPARPGNTISWSKDRARAHVVLLRVKQRRYLASPLLWPLMHEVGHASLGNPATEQSWKTFHERDCPERERHAWDAGAEVMKTEGATFGANDLREYHRAAEEACIQYKANRTPCRVCDAQARAK